ncbi:MAG: restriction endonuclease [Pseudacidovorax sp.]|uniref:restriction endonuclease n=1 Tax=Pseudacidovorax sp. TaxID=1934311 RepID=UPI001B52DCCE|nr:restriction endonuclease [Pseudacidovorax sp.]MBP6894411.1 restriction endonuclease [Pseudacidovorax sp.]
MSEKKELLAALHRTQLAPGNTDFRALLSQLAQTTLRKARSDADAFADVNLRKYWNWLAREIDEHIARGLTPFFLQATGGVFAISSACHTLAASGNAQDRSRGTLAMSRPQVLRQIDALTDREYEALACVSCTAIGSTQTLLTPPGNEGGIDFFATLSMHTKTHVFSAVGAEVRIVGQCKKYGSPVAVDKLEQFITTMQNVRHRSDRVRRHIPAWFEQSRGPIIGWVMAHSGFQTGAADEAKNHGIILSDTLDLAELICLSTGFHAALPPADRATKLVDECRNWL